MEKNIGLFLGIADERINIENNIHATMCDDLNFIKTTLNAACYRPPFEFSIIF